MTIAAVREAARPILVTGIRGQVGYELMRTLAPLAPVCGLDRSQLDLADADAITAAIRALKPIAIVNAAAYTSVDLAEDDSVMATSLNTVAPAIMAREAARIGACFVHYSTDYVFNGGSQRPYCEFDETAPLNVYGQTKRDGELAVMAAAGAAVILRSSWIYALRGRNFLTTILRLAGQQQSLRIVGDQTGSPTWARFVAEATALILARCGLSAERLREHAGIYHLAAADSTTWYGFARAILAATPGHDHVQVEAIASADYPVRAIRPAYSVLDTGHLTDTFAVRAPSWQEQLGLALEDRQRVQPAH